MRNFQGRKGLYGFLLAGVLFMFIVSVSPGYARMSADEPTWTTETVDSGAIYSSIAVDSRGMAHIAYADKINRHLKYATNATGSWAVETVDNSGEVKNVSIAVDSSDNAHISYDNYTNRVLKYAANVSGSWVIETVDNYHRPGYTWEVDDTSIAIDLSDNVHISYAIEEWDPYYGFLWYSAIRYATNVSGSWIIEDVGIGGYNLSIAVDTSGIVHIAYHFDYGHYEFDYVIRYVTNESGSWTDEPVVYAGEIGSIALDSENNVYISYGYYYYSGGEAIHTLEYVTNKSGAWVRETVDSEGFEIYRTKIALDRHDNIHISYSDRISFTDYEVKYVTNESGTWVTETVDSGIVVDMDIDSRGYMHIIYYDSTYSDLNYATNATPYYHGKKRGER